MTAPDGGLHIWPEDIQLANFCTDGGRRLFLMHRISWRRFCRHGLPASRLMAVNDYRFHLVVERKRERVNHGQVQA